MTTFISIQNLLALSASSEISCVTPLALYVDPLYLSTTFCSHKTCSIKAEQEKNKPTIHIEETILSEASGRHHRTAGIHTRPSTHVSMAAS